MMKNFVLCVAGVVVGFAVGFLITNNLTRPGAARVAARAPQAAAGPLDDAQAGGELPAGHQLRIVVAE